MLDGLTNEVERYMDLLSTRQRLVAGNIANATTPGFKTRDIDFASEFNSAIPDAAPAVQEIRGLKTKNDGNNVSLDRESRLLSENALRFNFAAQLLRSEVRMMKNAINEGKTS